MRHIDNYFTSENVELDEEAPLTVKGERKRLWDKITLAAAAVGSTLDNQDQRIIVSTLCCIVYDLMVETVKNYKFEHTGIDAPSTSSAMDDESGDVFQLRESNVSLYRYGGFALPPYAKEAAVIKIEI